MPCQDMFLNSKKTSNKIRKVFYQKWIETTERFIMEKPSELDFCKIVGNFEEAAWYSSIIIFYDEEYYKNFWDRNEEWQTWIKNNDEKYNLLKNRNIKTDLKYIGFREKNS